MIPLAKKNLHECEYHLNSMIKSQTVEELEINFAAFVNSARNVTFILQKEFKNNNDFLDWYGNHDKSQESNKGTKIYEMMNDELCIFFKNLRNQIVKEGINKIECGMELEGFNSDVDLIDRPEGSILAITGKGIYYLINKGRSTEDLIPAKIKANMIVNIMINDAPKIHLGNIIKNNNIIEISRIYYLYLKKIVEEWTSKLNKS